MNIGMKVKMRIGIIEDEQVNGILIQLQKVMKTLTKVT